jgi:hypothetical protein
LVISWWLVVGGWWLGIGHWAEKVKGKGKNFFLSFAF